MRPILRFPIDDAIAALPLPPTQAWPRGVWDTGVFQDGLTSAILFMPRGHDYQTAHDQDEFYVVVRGSGSLRVNDASHEFVPGDLLYVPALQPHHFDRFSQDFVAWAIFFGPRHGRSAT